MSHRSYRLLAIVTLLSATAHHIAAADQPTTGRRLSHLRRPVALVTPDGGHHFLVANRDSGTISRVDIATGRVTTEIRIGDRLSDLTLTPDGQHALVVDAGRRQLVVCRLENGQPAPAFRINLPIEPTRLAVDTAGGHVAVSSRWSRRLVLLDLPVTQSSRPRQVTLPMQGRHLLWLPQPDTLVVADAFGGSLAIVDAIAGRVLHAHHLPAHNIGGLALDPGSRHLVVSHQVLNSAARTTDNDVLWGLLITNNLRRIPIPELLSKHPLAVRRHSVVMLGQAGHAAGDPAGLAIRSDGSFVVALSGVNQVGIGRPEKFDLTRIPTGARPTAIWLSTDQRRAVVISTLDDQLDIVDLDKATSSKSISLGPRPESTSYDRGERLFFDAGLSRDGWMSCHSCHTDGHSNGQLVDTLGDGQYGNAKRVLSLLGTLDTRPWAWDGRMGTLRDQVFHSVSTTMRGPRPTQSQVRDLVAFLGGLQQPAPGHAATTRQQQQSVDRGRQLFTSLDCQRCHTPPLYTSPDSYDVGLGRLKTNPPSLRGVAQRRRLFHDNRAKSIDEVLGRFQHQLPRKISREEQRDLVRFLQSL